MIDAVARRLIKALTWWPRRKRRKDDHTAAEALELGRT